MKAKAIKFDSKYEYYHRYVMLIAAIFFDGVFRPREMDVIAAFASLDGEFIKIDRCGATGKKLVRKMLGGISASNLSNLMSEIARKGGMDILDRYYTLNPIFIPETMDEKIGVRLVCEEK